MQLAAVAKICTYNILFAWLCQVQLLGIPCILRWRYSLANTALPHNSSKQPLLLSRPPTGPASSVSFHSYTRLGIPPFLLRPRSNYRPNSKIPMKYYLEYANIATLLLRNRWTGRVTANRGSSWKNRPIQRNDNARVILNRPFDPWEMLGYVTQWQINSWLTLRFCFLPTNDITCWSSDSRLSVHLPFVPVNTRFHPTTRFVC